MKDISLYIRRLRGQSKKLAHKRMMDLDRLDIVLIQETMGRGSHLISNLKNPMASWNFLATQSEGFSEGLIIGWNQNVTLINTFSIHLGLCISKSLSLDLTILECIGIMRVSSHYGTNYLFISFSNLKILL